LFINRQNRQFSIYFYSNSKYEEDKKCPKIKASVFFTQSPSFLASQRLLQKRKGKNNLQKLLGVKKVPTDTQTRALLCAGSLKNGILAPII
jgi:hypothetical protein